MNILPPKAVSRQDMESVKKIMLAHDFTIENITRRIGVVYESKTFFGWEPDLDFEFALQKFSSKESSDELDILIKTFTFSMPANKDDLERVFSDKDIGTLKSMNLIIQMENGQYICPLSVIECQNMLIVTDSFNREVRQPVENAVMPIFPECYEFDFARSKKRVRKTLDLCTGSGVHALLAGKYCEHVIGADNNPRAIAFANFNKTFNNVENATFVLSDVYNALEGRKFNLITANPPYSPDKDYEAGDNFYAGGERGDAISSRIVKGLPEHLEEEGILQMIHLMICYDGETYEENVNKQLGESVKNYDILALTDPIDKDNVEDMTPLNITDIKFGITNIKKNSNRHHHYFLEAPFKTPLPYDVADAMEKLGKVPSHEERTEIITAMYQ